LGSRFGAYSQRECDVAAEKGDIYHLPGPPGISLPQRGEDVRHCAAARSPVAIDADDVHGGAEVMDIVDEFEGSPKFKAALAATDAQTRASFGKLNRYKKSKRYRTMKLIRNKVASHYDPVWIKETIEDLDAQHPGTALEVLLYFFVDLDPRIFFGPGVALTLST
jgi:hypothetical protein